MKMEVRFSLTRTATSLFVILFLLDFKKLQCNKVTGTSIDDGGTMFMEEVGESEIIPIETEHVPNEENISNSFLELKREVRETAATQKVSSPKINLGTTWGSEEEGSGDGDEEEDDEYYDLDQNLEGTIREENGENSNILSTPIMPTRVVPSLKSPLFGDSESEIEGTKRMTLPTDEIPIRATKPLEINNNVRSSIAHYDEIEEGSGYDQRSSIVPSRPTGTSYPTRPTTPDHSPVFNIPGITPYDGSEDLGEVTDRIINRSPYIQKKLKRYPVTAGRSVRILVPEDTFFDMEDGNTRNLRLDLRMENGSAIRNLWLRFDAKKQAIYALPANEDDVGRWKFRLYASDKEGEKVSDILEIVVRQYSRSRLVNHQFNIEFSFTDWDPLATRHWEWMMLDKVQRLYGDRKPNNIIVRKVRSNPYIFGWTNNSLLDIQNCPKEHIRGLFNQLVDERDKDNVHQRWGRPSPRLNSLLDGKAYVKNVTMTYHGTCLYDNEPNVRPNPDVSSNNEDTVPKMRNPIDRINVTAGELLRYKVPEDTCYDEEDGGTEKLSLSLLTTNRRELAPDAWLQFDSRNQEFVGIPLEEEVGRTEYQLVCSDRNGLSAIDGIEVIVLNRPFSEQYSIEFLMQFDDYQGFKRMKVQIVEKIANFFGDPDASNVVVNTFDIEENRIGWYNKSLAHLPCDHTALQWSRDKLLERDGKFKKQLAQMFAPYLRLINVEVLKRETCAVEAVPTPTQPSDRPGNGRATFFPGIPADYLLTFIIPAVIIICMLILAILLACVLHKKRKAGKLNLFYSESLPPRVPVILQDELYDENQDHLGMNGNGMYKQPVLLPEDHFHNPSQNNSNNRLNQAPEMDRLLQQQQAPVSIDPFSRGSLSRPTPLYQRRQM